MEYSKRLVHKLLQSVNFGLLQQGTLPLYTPKSRAAAKSASLDNIMKCQTKLPLTAVMPTQIKFTHLENRRPVISLNQISDGKACLAGRNLTSAIYLLIN